MGKHVIGREIVQGTICRDRFKATVTIACPDTVAPGGDAELGLSIRWRRERDSGSEAGVPDNAQPIVLELRKATSAATGDFRFDGAGGPTTKGFASDTQQLLTLHGQAPTAGAAPDVVLEVRIEGQAMGSIPLAVTARPNVLAIRAADGVTAPPSSILAASPLSLKAVVSPAVAGTFQWLSLAPEGLRINGPQDQETASIEAIGAAAGPRFVCVVFTPQGAPALMVALRLELGVRFAGRIEDRSVAPHYAEAATGHSYLASRPYQVVDPADIVLVSGTTAPDGRFDVSLPAGPTYRIRVPGLNGLRP